MSQAFAPSPDQTLANLCECFGSEGKLVLYYSRSLKQIVVHDAELSAVSACFWASQIRIWIHLSEVWIRILPFSHKGIKRTEIMLAK